MRAPHLDDGDVRLYLGDCVEVMREMDAESVDAVVCDPPYALPGGFMGKAWDRMDGRTDVGFAYYLSGLIDGEGCFRVGPKERRCEFSMKLRRDDRRILERMVAYLGTGRISDEPARDGSRPQARLVIDTKDGCALLVGFVRRFPLRAKKARDFEPWAEAVREWIEQPRGNRWSGPADRTQLIALSQRVRDAREYREVPWSGHSFQDWTREWAEEALRVLKPGGHLLAFGGTRTFHRLTCGIEDAGFEVRDCLSWLYGSGFPKSLDVSKAIDKQRDDRGDVLRVTAEIARLRGAAAMTNRDLDGLFGFAGMAGHWTSTKSQPAVPTVEQWSVLRDVLYPPSWLDAEVWRLNGRKGEPGEAWHQREVVGRGISAIANKAEGPRHTVGASKAVEFDITAPATDAARKWQGWGTALKPAFEPVVVARKPLVGTVAANVQQHGTGALNIDGCRIPHRSDADRAESEAKNQHSGYSNPGSNRDSYSGNMPPRTDYDGASGRWPANVAFDEDAAAMLDAQTGERKTGVCPADAVGIYGGSMSRRTAKAAANGGDTGGASRFFYTAKASRADRTTGGVANNTHPTVKPTDLMRWLVRLVTPPGGVVLDPFAGSGTTLVAARAEGFRAIGIEREEEYAQIIADRLSQLSLFSEAS